MIMHSGCHSRSGGMVGGGGGGRGDWRRSAESAVGGLLAFCMAPLVFWGGGTTVSTSAQRGSVGRCACDLHHVRVTVVLACVTRRARAARVVSSVRADIRGADWRVAVSCTVGERQALGVSFRYCSIAPLMLRFPTFAQPKRNE